MANLIAKADGNWTANTTWGNASAGGDAAQLTRSASTSVTGTSYTWSAAFTCLVTDVVDGVLLHLKRNGTTGTITVGLSEDNGATAAREVTVNGSDIPADPCWMFFKFGSTLACTGDGDYKVGVKCSAGGSGATVYRNATAGNWARLVRTTTAPAGAPAAADNTFIAKEWTSAGTGTARSVTMDNTGTTDHGTVDIGEGGTLSFGTSASTAYLLKVSGDVNVWSGGTLNMGTTGTPVPATSSAKLNFDCGSNVQYGLLIQNGGTFSGQGSSKTTWTYLAADALANATSLTTSASTGWKDNDEILVASTTRTYSQSEKGALNGDASGTTLTVDGFAGTGGGLKNAHSGTVPTRAEIGNLTRNVSIYGASASYQSYVWIANTATVDLDWVEMYWMGSNTTNKRGLDITTTTGSFNMAGCTFHTGAIAGSIIYINGTTASNATISNCIIGNLNGSFLAISATSGTWTVEDSLFIYNYQSGAVGLLLSDVGGTLSNCVVAGSIFWGIYLNEANAIAGTFEDLTVHSCGGGILVNLTHDEWNLSGGSIYRNNTYGISVSAAPTFYNSLISNVTFFGNGTANVNCAGVACLGVEFNTCTFAADSTFSVSYGVYFATTGSTNDAKFVNCTFGVASGIYVAHGTADVAANTVTYSRISIHNCNLASGTPTVGFNDATGFRHPYSRLSYQKYQQAKGDHRTYYQSGELKVDSGVYKTAAPSERATPVSATVKLESGAHRKIVNDGATATFSVWVRKSKAADGAAYNGAEPRLILRANPAAGIVADVALDTMTAGVGNWEQLTGTSAAVTDDGVLEAYVDCDGTAGWINIDDWS